MPCIAYASTCIGSPARDLISLANGIIAEYAAQGFKLTLRQLYYQFVARDLFPHTDKWIDPATGSTNSMKSYKSLSTIVGKGRMAGLIDWESIVDHTRMLRKRPEWDNPASILRECSCSFRMNYWKSQLVYPEVWFEKDAALSVFEGVCQELGVAYFSCRGYTSMTEMWEASQRFKNLIKGGKTVRIFHFGDHDPSGVQMSQDGIPSSS